MATNVLEIQMTSTEFEQAKTNMLLLDDVVGDVSLRQGSGGYVQFNQRSGGIGISQDVETIKITAQSNQTSLTLKPNGVGAYSGWLVFSNPMLPRWAVTSDGNNPPDDQTYIETDNVTKLESQKLEDASPRPIGINYVAFHAWSKATKTGDKDKIRIRFRTHNTDFENATDFTLKSSYSDCEVRYSKNPLTGLQWTWEEINDLEMGCRASYLATGGRVQVGEFSVIVDFTPPSSVTTILNGSTNSVDFVYRGGTGASAAETVLRGTSYIKVDMTQGLGFLRVEQDDGVKIRLDYDRIRIASETLVDQYTSLIQITFINLTKGDMGGSGTVNVKVQNMQITTVPHVLPGNVATIQVQWTSSGSVSGSFVFDAYKDDPNVFKTVVMFTEISIQVSTV